MSTFFVTLRDSQLETLLPLARQWIRRTTTTFDAEIMQTLQAGIIDLQTANVNNVDPNSAIIQQALKLYLKAQFGYNDEGDKFQKSYEFLKNSLALSGEYNLEDEE